MTIFITVISHLMSKSKQLENNRLNPIRQWRTDIKMYIELLKTILI